MGLCGGNICKVGHLLDPGGNFFYPNRLRQIPGTLPLPQDDAVLLCRLNLPHPQSAGHLYLQTLQLLLLGILVSERERFWMVSGSIHMQDHVAIENPRICVTASGFPQLRDEKLSLRQFTRTGMRLRPYAETGAGKPSLKYFHYLLYISYRVMQESYPRLVFQAYLKQGIS